MSHTILLLLRYQLSSFWNFKYPFLIPFHLVSYHFQCLWKQVGLNASPEWLSGSGGKFCSEYKMSQIFSFLGNLACVKKLTNSTSIWMHLLQWLCISGCGGKLVEFAINTHSGDIINKIVKFWKKLSLLSKKATLKCQCEHHFVKIWAKKFWMLHSANWGQRRRNLYKRTCKSLFPFPAKIPSKEKKGKLIFNTSSKVRLSLQIWWNCLELHTLLKKRKSFSKGLYPTLQNLEFRVLNYDFRI